MKVNIPDLKHLSDVAVLHLHRVYCEGYMKFGVPTLHIKRDYIYDYLLLRVPVVFEVECESVLNDLQIKLP